MPLSEQRGRGVKPYRWHYDPYFTDIKCPKCPKIITVCRNRQGDVYCPRCHTALCKRLMKGKREWFSKNENTQRQSDEVFVLQSIYNEEEISLKSNEPPFIGFLKIPVTPKNDRFAVYFREIASSSGTLLRSDFCVVKYLFIELFFFLPSQYPSESEPCYWLRCFWLSDELLARVCAKLTEIWRNNPGEILFTWVSFFTQDLYDFLQLENEIVITESECPRRQSSVLATTVTDENDSAIISREEKSNDTATMDVVCFESNPVLYKKYLKEKIVYDDSNNNSTGDNVINDEKNNGQVPLLPLGAGDDDDNTKNSVAVRERNATKRGRSKRQPLLASLEYVQLNNKMKFVYSNSSSRTGRPANERYKYETESETRKKMDSALFADLGAQKYVLRSSSVHDVDGQFEEYAPDGEKSDLSTNSPDPRSNETNSIKRNEYFIYGWLNFRSRLKLINGAVDCTNSHFVHQRYLRQEDKLRSLKEFNLSQFDKAVHCCEICYSDKRGSACLLLLPCCHIFCKDCIGEYVQTSISDYRVDNLTCPMTDCDLIINDRQLENVIDRHLYDRYKELKLRFTLDNHRDLLYCPREVCQNVAFVVNVAGDVMGHCRQCYYYFCVLCRKAYHGRESCNIGCQERKRIIERYRQGDNEIRQELEKRYSKKQLDRWVNEELSEQWIRDKGKPCPNCKAAIEKFTGCNKVICAKCGTPFCWLCDAVLKRNNPYSHFEDTRSLCHNKLFQGVNIDDVPVPNFADDYVDPDAINYLQFAFDDNEMSDFDEQRADLDN